MECQNKSDIANNNPEAGQTNDQVEKNLENADKISLVSLPSESSNSDDSDDAGEKKEACESGDEDNQPSKFLILLKSLLFNFNTFVLGYYRKEKKRWRVFGKV